MWPWSDQKKTPVRRLAAVCALGAWAALAALVGSAGTAGALEAQDPPPPPSGLSAYDSAEVRQTAERRVRDYRREVRGEGGVAVSGGLRVPVDVVEAERARLIADLDGFGRQIPGDDWIVGQRVAFRIKQGPVERAVAAARDCRASDWWCSALLGFTLHASRDLEGADLAFRRALDRMPPEQRCGWRDSLSPILHGALGRRYGRANCEEREHLAEQVWWLAHPFHLRPWNDRRTEHYTRLVGILLYAQGLGAAGRRCGWECGRMALFRGWPPGWWSPERPFVFQDVPGYRFIPPSDVGLRPLESEAWDWDLVDDEYHERYDPHYGPVHPLDQQTAFLRRGDSILVLAAAEMDRHILRGAPSLEVGVALSRGPGEARHIAREEGPPARTLLRTHVPRDRYLVSVEALAERSGAARARFGQGLPEPSASGIATSDPILFDWSGEPPGTLGDVLPVMLGTDRLERSRDVAVFWEVYGAETADELAVSLAARRVEVGFFRRIGQALRVVGPAEAMRFSWREEASAEGVGGRSLHLDLSELEPGRYVLELRVGRVGEEPAVARRPFEMRAF